jgi:N-acetylmuramoyl-L-alanine amidase
MIEFAYYLLKAAACSGILFLYYCLFLRNRRFHRWNRVYLLASVALSLLLPLCRFTIERDPVEQPHPAIRVLDVVQSADSYVEEITLGRGPVITAAQGVSYGYMLISVTLLFALAISLLRIRRLIRRHEAAPLHGIRIVRAGDVKGTPFSFFRYIFWNGEIDMDSETGRQILRHELAHVKGRHSADKLFLELMLIPFWANPVFWLIRRELKLVHEFIADEEAVDRNDTAAFAAMVLQSAFPRQFSTLTNPFFQSPIKRRLSMLTKNHKPQLGYISRLLILPVLAITAFAFTIKTKQPSLLPKLEKEIVVVLDAGHGGNDHGARSGELHEKDITLKLANYVHELNENKKIKIVLTRTGDAPPALHERVRIASENKADLFISLHVNAAPESKDNKKENPGGIEITIPRENPSLQKSILLGSVLKEELSSLYPVNPKLLQRQTGVFVLNKNVCPAVLVECGYITNPKDREFITSEANQKAVAKKILDAIVRYAAEKS